MVTGRRAFGGDTALDRMTAILREAPAPIVSTATRPLPPALVRIVDSRIARDLSHALMTKPVDGTARDTPLIVRDNWLQLLGTTK